MISFHVMFKRDGHRAIRPETAATSRGPSVIELAAATLAIASLGCSVLSLPVPAAACTIVKATKGGRTIVGNNEDGTDPTTHLWFIPPSPGKYGRVYFTLSDKRPQGGMNDQGLFYDGTAGPWKDVVGSASKPEYRGNLSEKMLEECATVPEAVAFLRKYNLRYFRNGQMLLADRMGNSAIIEGDVILNGDSERQIVTNFYHSNPGLGGFPCHRYDIAEAMVSSLRTISVDSMRKILRAVHLEGYSFTQYSTILDPAGLTVWVFQDSDFERCVKIDLKAELRKGERRFETGEFFARGSATVWLDREPARFGEALESRRDDGSLRCRLRLTDDLLDGICEGFHPNGRPAWRAAFDHGRPTGNLSTWKEDGTPALSYEFLDGKRTDLLDHFPGGGLFLKIRLERVGRDGLAPSRMDVFNEDGTSSFQGVYKNGKLCAEDDPRPFTGTVAAAFRNGGPYSVTEYRDGLCHGTSTRRDRNGRVREVQEFAGGRLIGVKRY